MEPIEGNYLDEAMPRMVGSREVLLPSDPGFLIYRQEVYDIAGAAMEVLNTLGHGFHEKAYENALVVEFSHRNIPFVQQPSFDIRYKGVKVAEFVPNLVLYGKIIVDTKTVPKLTTREVGQMLNYLNVTELNLGLLINFANPKLEWQRVVLSEHRHRR